MSRDYVKVVVLVMSPTEGFSLGVVDLQKKKKKKKKEIMTIF